MSAIASLKRAGIRIQVIRDNVTNSTHLNEYELYAMETPAEADSYVKFTILVQVMALMA